MRLIWFVALAGLAFWLSFEAFQTAHALTKENDAWASDAFWLGALWLLMGLRNANAAFKEEE